MYYAESAVSSGEGKLESAIKDAINHDDVLITLKPITLSN